MNTETVKKREKEEALNRSGSAKRGEGDGCSGYGGVDGK